MAKLEGMFQVTWEGRVGTPGLQNRLCYMWVLAPVGQPRCLWVQAWPCLSVRPDSRGWRQLRAFSCGVFCSQTRTLPRGSLEFCHHPLSGTHTPKMA